MLFPKDRYVKYRLKAILDLRNGNITYRPEVFDPYYSAWSGVYGSTSDMTEEMAKKCCDNHAGRWDKDYEPRV